MEWDPIPDPFAAPSLHIPLCGLAEESCLQHVHTNAVYFRQASCNFEHGRVLASWMKQNAPYIPRL